MGATVTKMRLASLALIVGLGMAAQAPADTIQLNIPPDTEHRQISVVVTRGLTSTTKLRSPALRDARRRMMAGEDLKPEELQALADHWDGLAALKYERYLKASVADASASDIAWYGTIAVSTGRVWPLPDVVDALRELDPATEPALRKKAYVAMLYPHAWAGNSLAIDAVIDLNGEGKLFGPMSAATEKRIMAEGDKIGDGRVALHLALVLIQKPDRTQADVEMAQHYLKTAQASDNIEVKTTAANLASLLAADMTGTASQG